MEFKELKLPFKFDFERLVDDFVFLCFFVGNDFLPHLPSLQIREGALDAIMAMYKNALPSLDGYLTNSGRINFSNCDVLFRDIAKYEEEFFRFEQDKIQREREYAASGRGGRGGRGRFGNRFQDRNKEPEDPNAPQPTSEEVLAKAKEDLHQELAKGSLTEQEKLLIVEKAMKS